MLRIARGTWPEVNARDFSQISGKTAALMDEREQAVYDCQDQEAQRLMKDIAKSRKRDRNDKIISTLEKVAEEKEVWKMLKHLRSDY